MTAPRDALAVLREVVKNRPSCIAKREQRLCWAPWTKYDGDEWWCDEHAPPHAIDADDAPVIREALALIARADAEPKQRKRPDWERAGINLNPVHYETYPGVRLAERSATINRPDCLECSDRGRVWDGDEGATKPCVCARWGVWLSGRGERLSRWDIQRVTRRRAEKVADLYNGANFSFRAEVRELPEEMRK